jgi:hypothetical protein
MAGWLSFSISLDKVLVIISRCREHRSFSNIRATPVISRFFRTFANTMEICCQIDSRHLHRRMEVRVYGSAGLPVLAFPTQDGMADQWKGFGMVDALAPWLEAGAIRLFTVDTVDIRTWSNKYARKDYRIRVQEQYFQWIVDEGVLPRRAAAAAHRLQHGRCP